MDQFYVASSESCICRGFSRQLLYQLMQLPMFPSLSCCLHISTYGIHLFLLVVPCIAIFLPL